MKSLSPAELTVLFLAAILFLWQLGAHDPWAPDEPYFAEGAREMVVDGNWVVPHVNGVVTPDKPPLFFWLIALFSLLGGEVTGWTARIPSALAGLGTVALTLRLGRHFAGPRTAALGGFVLCTAYMFWDKARWSQTDALLCFLIWVALSAFEAFRSGHASGRRAGLLFWLAAALAVLVKGPVGFLLPLGIALVALAIDRDLARYRRFAPWTGPLLFAAVVGAWIAATMAWGPPEYSVWVALKEHFVERGISGMHHRRPPWYYLESLPMTLLPWTGLLPGALVLAFRRRARSDRFLLVAALFVLVFFTVSTEKRDLYVLPSFPALALLIARLIGAVRGWGEEAQAPSPIDRRWVTIGLGVVGGVLAVAGVVGAGLVAAGPEIPRVETLPAASAILVGTILTTGGLAALALAARGRALFSTLALGGCAAAAYLAMVTTVYPWMEPTKSARPFSRRLAEVAGPSSYAEGLPVLTYGLGNLPEAFAFYTDGLYTTPARDANELAAHLARPQQVFAVVRGSRLEELPEEVLLQSYVIEAARLSRRDVLLITNRRYPGAEPLTGDR